MWAITEIKALGAISLVWLHLPIFLAEMLQLKQNFREVWYSRIFQYPIWMYWRNLSEDQQKLRVPCASHVCRPCPRELWYRSCQWKVRVAECKPPCAHGHTEIRISVLSLTPERQSKLLIPISGEAQVLIFCPKGKIEACHLWLWGRLEMSLYLPFPPKNCWWLPKSYQPDNEGL